MRRILVASAVWAMGAGLATAQAGPDTRFEDGSRVPWTAQPAHADMWAAITRAGLGHSDIDDWAVVVCTIGENRRLTDCETFRESSPGSQIAEAIMEMGRIYRASRTDGDGRPTAGRRVYLAMGYGGVFIP